MSLLSLRSSIIVQSICISSDPCLSTHCSLFSQLTAISQLSNNFSAQQRFLSSAAVSQLSSSFSAQQHFSAQHRFLSSAQFLRSAAVSQLSFSASIDNFSARQQYPSTYFSAAVLHCPSFSCHRTRHIAISTLFTFASPRFHLFLSQFQSS